MLVRPMVAVAMLVLSGCSLLSDTPTTRSAACDLDPRLVGSVVGDTTWYEVENALGVDRPPGGDVCDIVAYGTTAVAVQVSTYTDSRPRRRAIEELASARASQRRSCDELTQIDRPYPGTGCAEEGSYEWTAVFRRQLVRIVVNEWSVVEGQDPDIDSARRLAEDLDESLSRR